MQAVMGNPTTLLARRRYSALSILSIGMII